MAETIGLRAVIDLKNFNKGLSSYNKGIGRMNKQTSSFTSTATKQFTSLGSGVLKFGAIAGGAALVGITALTAGLVAFGASAVKEGAAYTKAMSNVKAITGATAEEFDALSVSAEELGRTTKFTATEAAEGMGFLAMAGFEVNEVISAMPGVLNLAAAGNLQLGQSADIVSNILTGFGAEADQTGRFVDVLTKTFTSSNTNLVQLGQAMKFVAPVAADLGLSVEQTAAAMGVLGDGGIQASMAGTTLRTALLNLAAPVGKGKALIEELGIEIFDAQGKMLPFPEVIGSFNEAMEGMSDAQKTATLRTIIGKRAISGFSLLLKKGEKGLETFGNELLASGGTAAEIAATQLDNLSGDVTLFKSALSGIKIDVFKALEPVLRGVVGQGKFLLATFGPQLTAIFKGAIASVTNFVNKVMGAFQRFGIRGAAVSILGQLGLGPDQIAMVFGVVDDIIAIINKISGAFERFGIRGATISILGLLGLEPSQISNVLSIVDSFVEGVITAFGKVTGAFERFGARGAAISVLGLLGLGPDTIATVLSIVDGIIMGIQQLPIFFSQAFTFITENIESFKGALFGIGGVLLGGAVLGAVVAVGSAIFALLTPINLIIVAAALLGAAWAGNWGNIQGVTMQAVAVILTGIEILKGVFAGLVAAIVPAFNTLTETMAGLGITWSDIGMALLAATGIVFAGIGAVILAAISIVVGLGVAVLDTISFVIATFQSLLTSVSTAIGGLIQIWNGLVTIFTGGGILAGLQIIGAGIVNFISGLVTSVTTLLTAPLEIILNFLQSLGEGIFAFWESLSNTLVGNSIIPDMVAAIISAFTSMVEPILSIFATLSEGIASVLGAIFGGGGEEAQAPTIAFDPAEMLAGMQAVNVAIDNVNLSLTNISTITIPLLQETFLVMTTVMIEQLLLLLSTGIMPVDLALVLMTTVTLPNLQATAIAVAASIVTAFIPVQDIISIITGLVITLSATFVTMGKNALKAGEDTAKGMEKAKDKIDDLIQIIKKATTAFEKLAEAAKDAARASSSVGAASSQAGGLGFAKGIGFQAGTPGNTNGLLGLGFKIPPGFPNDSFGPLFAQSGEEMLVTPRGTSIEGLFFSRLAALLRGTSVQGGGVTNNITNIEMNMNLRTTSSARATIQQFEIQRGLLGV